MLLLESCCMSAPISRTHAGRRRGRFVNRRDCATQLGRAAQPTINARIGCALRAKSSTWQSHKPGGLEAKQLQCAQRGTPKTPCRMLSPATCAARQPARRRIALEPTRKTLFHSLPVGTTRRFRGAHTAMEAPMPTTHNSSKHDLT